MAAVRPGTHARALALAKKIAAVGAGVAVLSGAVLAVARTDSVIERVAALERAGVRRERAIGRLDGKLDALLDFFHVPHPRRDFLDDADQ